MKKNFFYQIKPLPLFIIVIFFLILFIWGVNQLYFKNLVPDDQAIKTGQPADKNVISNGEILDFQEELTQGESVHFLLEPSIDLSEEEIKQDLEKQKKELVNKNINGFQVKISPPSEIIPLGSNESTLNFNLVLKNLNIKKEDLLSICNKFLQEYLENDNKNFQRIEIRIFSNEDLLNQIPDIGKVVVEEGKMTFSEE
ncbi:MAG: hypothetical protein ACPLYC_00335 [Minisyncoccia bacterium]